VKQLLQIHDPSARKALDARASLPLFDPTLLAQHAPDAHWVLLDDDGLVAGHFSLWWTATPDLAGHRVGLIGHYAADGMDVGRLLLARATEELKTRHCTLAVGPMDGNTWRPYRFVTAGAVEPPFFLEPTNPPEWPRQFVEHGFTPLANYYSSLDERLEERDEDAQSRRAAERMNRLGVTLRPLDTTRFQEELRGIHRVATASFSGGFLYQPVSEAAFLAQYESIRACVRPELVTIAMHGNHPVGFAFALPDRLRARPGQPIDTAIIKTLAILPERRYAGLGTHLVAECRRAARAAGCRRLIHALMHEANRSRNIRADCTSEFRRYTLFAQSL